MKDNNKRNSDHQHFTRSKRQEEIDRNRGEYQGVSNINAPNRRDNRSSLRGRKEYSVLPLSNTPLYGIDEPDLREDMNPSDLPFAEMANFCSGSGERVSGASVYNVASGGILPPNTPYVATVENNLNRDLGATRMQSNVQGPSVQQMETNQNVGLDPNTMNFMKELIVNTQKTMMADIISDLTKSFKDTLKVETQKIVQQVTENQNPKPTSQGQGFGNPSTYRLDYREPRLNSSEGQPIDNDFYPRQVQPPQNTNFINFRLPEAPNQLPTQPNINTPHNPNPNQQPPYQGAQNHARQYDHDRPQNQDRPYNHNHPPEQDRPLNHGRPNLPPPYGNIQYYQNPNKVLLDKWGFRFNGSNMSVEDFLFRIECKQQTSNITWPEVYNNLNNILSEPVETWYWTYRKNNPNADYELFKLSLSERYPSKDSDVDRWRKLINRKQKNGETFDDFVDDIERIYYRMTDRPTPMQLISVIRDNVSPEISQYIGLARINSLVGIKTLAREAEKLVEKLNPASKQSTKPFKRNINEVSSEEFCPTDDDHIFIEAFSGPKKDFKVFQCKKCKQKFRVNEETREEKRIYCYGCGKEGVIVSNCPVCTENHKTPE